MVALITNRGFEQTAKLITGTGGTAFTFLAVGLGSQTELVGLETLATEIVATSGLSRVSVTPTTATSATSGTYDTGVWANTWTAQESQAVKEAGIFQHLSTATASGRMLAYATFTNAIPMEPADTLQVTWSVKVCPGA